MTIYTARANRGAGWWSISVDEIEELTTRSRLLEQVPHRVRESLADFPETESHPEDAIVLVIPEGDSDALHQMKELDERVRKLQGEASQAMRLAARELSAQGLAFRDVGEILGVSCRRAQSLVAD